MLRVIFLAKETSSSISALNTIIENKNLCKIERAVIRQDASHLLELCKNNNIKVCSEEELILDYNNKEYECDYLFSFYWKKAGKDILDIPKMGAINFHPGPLPEAGGSGYHAAIIENWGYWGVTTHFMVEEFDKGDIIKCDRFEIGDNILNYQLVNLTHEKLAIQFSEVFKMILSGENLPKTPQSEGRYFSLKEVEDNKIIHKNDSAELIDRKIRAYWHPPYTGAQIELKGKKYTLIDEYILKDLLKKNDKNN